MFDAIGVLVLISAPGDTSEEVEAIKGPLHGLNGSRVERCAPPTLEVGRDPADGLGRPAGHQQRAHR
jgi:hypothetical protein